MIPLLAVFLAALALSWSNGANDNFKGVATLLGSRTCGPRAALAWGTATTLAGSVAALLLSGRLLTAFSGKDIVPGAFVGDPTFLACVGGAAAATVMLATVVGMPISTTHALVGGLAGAGMASAGWEALGWGTLASSFLVPLLVSPVLATGLVAVSYPLLHRLRLSTGIEADSCVCAGVEPSLVPAPVGFAGRSSMASSNPALRLSVRQGRGHECASGYGGRFLGIGARPLLDVLHYLSAGAVGFARGLNDTPKVAALLLVGGAFGHPSAIVVVGLGMAAGAVLQALRVGRTMSDRIVPMNAGQGFTANLATSALVIGASRLGVPVSTTHVSVGALFGLGTATSKLDRAVLGRILLSWVATLPLAFLFAGLLWHLLGA